MLLSHIFLWCCVSILYCLLLFLDTSDAARFRDVSLHDAQRAKYSHRKIQRQKQRVTGYGRSERPNIVMIITDDQDLLLDSMSAMPKTLKILKDNGATFKNAFVTTPMCCPSRSTILTGLYTHNHNVFTNNDNCSSPQWQKTHESRTFATYLSDVGYRTGYFGKYLNKYNGSYIPAGWREWVGLVKNSRFYNYTINFNGDKVRHGDNYYKDYLTDLIANDSVTFLKQSKQHVQDKPVLMVLSVPAPHGPEDAAPQYQHMFNNTTSHRTKSWNYAPNADKQWLLQHTRKMEPLLQTFTNLLQQKRLQTLQSVDDLVAKVHSELRNLGELDNTYIIYTSDHGYHLGQFGLVKGKAMPYDFDIRVPLFIRGPGIHEGLEINNLVSSIDIAPTILDMAGVPIPDHMDGRSMLRLIKNSRDAISLDSTGFVKQRKPWRDTILIERGKVTRKRINLLLRKEKHYFRGLRKSKELKLLTITGDKKVTKFCSKQKNQSPCSPNQAIECRQDEKGNLRLYRCDIMQNDSPYTAKSCDCRQKDSKSPRRRQQSHATRFGQRDSPRFKARLARRFGHSTRSKRASDPRLPVAFTDFSNHKQDIMRRDKRCRVLSNDTVDCDPILYENMDSWKQMKDDLDIKIQSYKKYLNSLKGIRKHLKQQKPSGFSDNDSSDSPTEILNSNCDCDEIARQTDANSVFGKTDIGDVYTSEEAEEGYDKAYNSHWQSTRNRRIMKKMRKRHRNKKKFGQECDQTNMKCFVHDNAQWRTPPYWNLGPFCFCSNANNNTYWCLRTVNETHDFLYCEFITGFISYYDMKTDPDQLHNAVHDLNYGILQQLHDNLLQMRSCKGSKACTIRTKEDITFTEIPLKEITVDDPIQTSDGMFLGSGEIHDPHSYNVESVFYG